MEHEQNKRSRQQAADTNLMLPGHTAHSGICDRLQSGKLEFLKDLHKSDNCICFGPEVTLLQLFKWELLENDFT